MKTSGLVLSIIMIAFFLVPVQAINIPPTPAIPEIITDNGIVQAMNYSTTIIIHGTNGTKVFGNNTTKTITIYGSNSSTVSTLPIVVSQVALTMQQNSINATNLYTPIINDVYRVSVYQVDSQSAIAGTLSTTITWTDQTGTTQGINPASNLSLISLHGFSQGTAYIDVLGTTNITYQTSLSGVTGTPQYSLYITVEKLS